MAGLDPKLLILALNTARSSAVKAGFVPSDAAAGAPPGGDPSGGGGAPPPADPAAGGGAPPPDPSAGGAPPPPPPPDPSTGMDPSSIAGQVAQGVQQALAQSGLKGGGMGPNGKPTAPKPDINTIATDVFQLKKLMLNVFRRNNWEIPPEILDGPNRDPLTGAPAMSPTGGSDVQPGASAQPGQGAGPGAGGGAIPPIQPMEGAFPSAPGGAGGGVKTGADEAFRIGAEISGHHVASKAAALAHMFRRRREGAAV